MYELKPETKHIPRALAVAVQRQQQTNTERAASFAEVTRLAETLGIQVCGTMTQKRDAPLSATYVGEGKLDEIRERLHLDFDLVVVDDELTPRQQVGMQEVLGVEVIDRTGLILEIFESRAQTRMAMIEVEIARLEYELPRQRKDDKSEGRRGGGGRGERGHTNVELSKGRIRDRIAALRAELENAQAAEQARRDARSELFSVALVGYTNAGKSSLMRALTGSDVYVENQLFATLDTRARRLQPSTNPPVVVSDTVGFIRDLPHELVASFRSTLAEAAHADLLLLVVDAADEQRHEHLEVTQSTLDSLDVTGRRLLVYNKVDLARGELDLGDGLAVSAFDEQLVGELRDAILAAQAEELCESTLLVPFARGQLLSEIFEHARVLHEDHDERGTQLRLLASEGRLRRWERQLNA